ncbi:hypothetical protein AND_009940 [Anopheles darlingi]|uniref:Uncharacterized protein n=1 Tax=Anopheles darlingi TaxID=43151 RepID=W5J6K2_ANODA|nr:hypothetical protein AND_009940 [Anopheles darlingi]
MKRSPFLHGGGTGDSDTFPVHVQHHQGKAQRRVDDCLSPNDHNDREYDHNVPAIDANRGSWGSRSYRELRDTQLRCGATKLTNVFNCFTQPVDCRSIELHSDR